MSTQSELQATVDALVQKGKGILAADESGPTIAKRLEAIGVESTEENRRAYRNLLLGAPGLGEFVSGVILYEETLGQCTDDGTPLPQLAAQQGIVPGIKVDAGKIALAGAPGDEITQGLDGLAKRVDAYKRQGVRFAKWRAVYNVSATLPSPLAIEANADSLARYAAICQQQGIVPIVEPEVLIDGDHTMVRCAEVTEAVLHEVFHALHRTGWCSSTCCSSRAWCFPARRTHHRQCLPRSPRRRSGSCGARCRRRFRASTSCPAARRPWRRRPISMR